MKFRIYKLQQFTSIQCDDYHQKPTPYHHHKPFFQKRLRFSTTKKLDAEAVYYHEARYLDPRTSRWLGVDPAMHQGDYIPSAPIDDEARKRNGNLPGQGGIYNYVNLHVYHYAGNNPIKYVDTDGEETTVIYISNKSDSWNKIAGGSHVALYVSNPGLSSNGMVWVDPAIYDPSGSFSLSETGARPGDAIFSEDVNSGSILKDFLDYHLGLGAEITLYKIDTNSKQEANILETASDNGERYLLFPMSCAKDVSAALKGIGINETSTPGGIKKQMETMVENGKAQKVFIEN